MIGWQQRMDRRGQTAKGIGVAALAVVAVFVTGLGLWKTPEGVAQTPSLLPKLEEISQKLDSHLERFTRRLAGIEGTLGDLQRDQAKMRDEWNAKLEAQRQTLEQKFAAHRQAAQQQQEAFAQKLEALKLALEQKFDTQRQTLEQKFAAHRQAAQQQQEAFAQKLEALKQALEQKFEVLKQALEQKLGTLKQTLEDKFKSISAEFATASRERRSEALSILEIVKLLRAGSRREVVGLPGGMMRYLPPGSFVQDGRTVTFTKGAWMLETEVTQAQYKALVGVLPEQLGFKDCGNTCPVEQVSWHQAAFFANELSKKENLASCFTCTGSGEAVSCTADHEKYNTSCKGWRLPTEAEWEYAARAGTARDTYGTLDDTAWYSGNSSSKTHPVGQKQANAWGLHDMLGNVWEWCYDWYGSYTAGAQSDPAGPSSGSSRVSRGGGWIYGASDARASYRGSSTPSFRNSDLGFRLLRSE